MSEHTILRQEQLNEMESPIFSIDHVQIPICGDLQQAAEWYQNMFGVGDNLPSPYDDCWFAGIPTSRGNLFLIKTDDADSKASFNKAGKEFPVIMFKTFRIDEIHKKLLVDNVKIVAYDEEKDENKDHFRFLTFYVLWGNLLGFIQDPPSVPWYGTR
ncbi:VOC family protein [Lederbergia panacisoli]|uniref:VOC family protein n=1 Tax=Lederbergia panacisoli TaxID=1255251 RepID=UPI00214BD5EE|nr:hypothetical protein [Lederbergia panacisoli]MCR2823723.1 hypothetical protein [Lederbergia panacisoli]